MIQGCCSYSCFRVVEKLMVLLFQGSGAFDGVAGKGTSRDSDQVQDSNLAFQTS